MEKSKATLAIDEKTSVTYEELPDTITPNDYAKWRRIGLNAAREAFKSRGFPILPHIGQKQLADKRAVLLFELGMNDEERTKFYKELAEKLVSKKQKKEEMITSEKEKIPTYKVWKVNA